MHDLILAVHERSDAMLDDVRADPASHLIGYGKCCVNPTVRVHNVLRDAFDDTINGIAKILTRRDQQRAHHQHDDGGFVMHFEHIIVDADRVDLEQSSHGAEKIVHFPAAVVVVTRESN